jgi:hypothetical protein
MFKVKNFNNKKLSNNLNIFNQKVVYSKFRLINSFSTEENNTLDHTINCQTSSKIINAEQSLFEQYLNSMVCFITEKQV